MNFAQESQEIFDRATRVYHDTGADIDTPCPAEYPEGSIQQTLFAKNWIDARQWHMEDLIRDPHIDPVRGMELKRVIDRANQERTDMVEELDTYFRNLPSGVKVREDATINTESPAWALDRLSILSLKIYHMAQEVERTDVDDAHRARCRAKLDVLLEQQRDLVSAIGDLLDDIAAGRKYMKVYRQMKMYNDPTTNPVLYAKK